MCRLGHLTGAATPSSLPISEPPPPPNAAVNALSISTGIGIWRLLCARIQACWGEVGISSVQIPESESESSGVPTDRLLSLNTRSLS